MISQRLQVTRVLQLQGLFFSVSFNHSRANELVDEPWNFRHWAPWSHAQFPCAR